MRCTSCNAPIGDPSRGYYLITPGGEHRPFCARLCLGRYLQQVEREAERLRRRR